MVFDKDIIHDFIVTKDLPKAKLYAMLREKPQDANLSNIISKEEHKIRVSLPTLHLANFACETCLLTLIFPFFLQRRFISPAFSISYINSIMPLINSCVEDVVTFLNREYARDGENTVVDIWGLMSRMSLVRAWDS